MPLIAGPASSSYVMDESRIRSRSCTNQNERLKLRRTKMSVLACFIGV